MNVQEAFSMDSSILPVVVKPEDITNPWSNFLCLESPNSINYIKNEGCIQESSIAMLDRDDMDLYGFCPFEDELFLSKCSCGIVVKSQALQVHLDNLMHHNTDASSTLEKTAVCRDFKRVRPKKHVISPYSQLPTYKNFHVPPIKPAAKELPASSTGLFMSSLIPHSSISTSTVPSKVVPPTTNSLFSTYTNFVYTYASQPTTSNNYSASPSSSSSSSPLSLLVEGPPGVAKSAKALLPAKKLSLVPKSAVFSPKTAAANSAFPPNSILDCPRLDDMRTDTDAFSMAASLGSVAAGSSEMAKIEKKTPTLEKLVLRRVLQSDKNSAGVRRPSLQKGVKGDSQNDNSAQETYFMVVKDKNVENRSNFLAATQQIKKESNEAHQQSDRVMKKIKEIDCYRDSMIHQLFQESTHYKKKHKNSLATITELKKQLTSLEAEKADLMKVTNAEKEALQKENIDLQNKTQQLKSYIGHCNNKLQQVYKVYQNEKKQGDFYKRNYREVKMKNDLYEKHSTPEMVVGVNKIFEMHKNSLLQRHSANVAGARSETFVTSASTAHLVNGVGLSATPQEGTSLVTSQDVQREPPEDVS